MNIERAILTALDRMVVPSGHRAEPELSLLADVCAIQNDSITLTPLRRACASLEAKRQVVSVASEDHGTMWKITPDGLARLAE
jgi:hypothetical protein